MKITVKNLIGSKFQIEVKPQDTVADVKQNIETVKGPDVYPVSEQKLVYRGEFLEDATTLEENKVAENSTILVLLSKGQSSTSGSSTTSAAPTTAGLSEQTEVPTVAQAPVDGPSTNPPPPPPGDPNANPHDLYPQSKSSTSGSSTTPLTARIAGILEQAIFPPVAQAPVDGSARNPPPPPGPDTRSLDLFPQERRYANPNPSGVIIDSLRNNRRFTNFRALAQISPQIYQLERIGYDRARVVDALVACNMNEAQALRYLSGQLDNSESESKSEEDGTQ